MPRAALRCKDVTLAMTCDERMQVALEVTDANAGVVPVGLGGSIPDSDFFGFAHSGNALIGGYRIDVVAAERNGNSTELYEGAALTGPWQEVTRVRPGGQVLAFGVDPKTNLPIHS